MAHPLAAQVTALNTNLPSHLLQNLLITTQAISLAGSTNLSKAKRFVPQIIGTKQALEAQPLSNYQRLIRFFNEAVGDHQDDVHHCIQDITAAVIGNFRPSSLKKARHLVIDGSKWKARLEKIQFLSLCVVVENTALPIASIDLAKIGHSSQKERGAFLDRAAEHLDLRGMILLGDREYVGIQWFKDLKADRGIDFVIRVKKGIYHKQVNEAPGRSWEEMHRKLERNRKVKTVSKPIVLGGQTYRYVIARNSKAGHPNEDDYIYFLTSHERYPPKDASVKLCGPDSICSHKIYQIIAVGGRADCFDLKSLQPLRGVGGRAACSDPAVLSPFIYRFVLLSFNPSILQSFHPSFLVPRRARDGSRRSGSDEPAGPTDRARRNSPAAPPGEGGAGTQDEC